MYTNFLLTKLSLLIGTKVEGDTSDQNLQSEQEACDIKSGDEEQMELDNDEKEEEQAESDIDEEEAEREDSDEEWKLSEEECDALYNTYGDDDAEVDNPG